MSLRSDSTRTKSTGVSDEIYRNGIARQTAIAIPVLSSEAAASNRTAETANTGETVVVEQDNVDLDVLLQGRHDLLRHHEVGTITNQNVDFAAGIRHLDTEPSGNFIAHAGIAILQVIAL